MWLFEVTDTVRPGVKLVLAPGRMGVPLGTDAVYGTTMMLPIGKSISRLLDHPDDQREEFILLRGTLSEDKLVKQTEEEALAEGKALVFIDRCTEAALGQTRITDAWQKSKPTLIKTYKMVGYDVELYEFKPGDGLFISWSAAALGKLRPKRFAITWDGKQLVAKVFRRRLKQRRAQKQQQASVQVKREQGQQRAQLTA